MIVVKFSTTYIHHCNKLQYTNKNKAYLLGFVVALLWATAYARNGAWTQKLVLCVAKETQKQGRSSCGPRTTLRSAQPRPIGRVSTRPVARDLTDSAVCSSRIVLFPYFAWRAVQSWGRSTAATQLLAAASTAIAHRTPTTDIVISTSANAKQQPSRSRHSELLCQR